MEELAYTLTDTNGVQTTYTIVEYMSVDTFDFMPNGGTVRRAKRDEGKWIQLDGVETAPEILQELGKLMEQHHQQQKIRNQ